MRPSRSIYFVSLLCSSPLIAGPCDPEVLLGPASTRFLGSSSEPARIVTADLDADGNADLIVAEKFADRVSVHLGLGDGTFAPASHFSTGDQPVGLAIVDFDGDSHLDIATGNQNDSSVTILLGDGMGGFVSGGNYDAGFFVTPDDLACADFDGDNDIDIVTSSQGNSVRVMLNNGDGSFALPVFVNILSSVNSVAVGLLNNDSIPDIVATGLTTNEVFVLLGLGNGAFSAPVAFDTSNGPRDVQIADINDDGHMDLVVAHTFDDLVGVHLGNSTGVFAPAINSTLGTGLLEVQPADMDGDGNLDLMAATFGTFPQAIAMVRGNGDGTFSSQNDFPSGNGPVSIVIADFDNDSGPDVAAVHSASNDLYIYLNQCPPNFCGCNPADLAAPCGSLDFFDVSAFLSAFIAMDPVADFAAPFGTFNFFDVSAFLIAFNNGCP